MPSHAGLLLAVDLDWRGSGKVVSGFSTEQGAEQGFAFLEKVDQTLVEGGIREGGEEEAVVGVQAFGVGFAGGPGDDVACAQEGGVGDSGQGATGVPAGHQGGAEQVLADALHDQALGLGGFGEVLGFGGEVSEGGIVQGRREVVGLGDGLVEGGHGEQREGGDAGAGLGQG